MSVPKKMVSDVSRIELLIEKGSHRTLIRLLPVGLCRLLTTEYKIVENWSTVFELSRAQGLNKVIKVAEDLLICDSEAVYNFRHFILMKKRKLLLVWHMQASDMKP